MKGSKILILMLLSLGLVTSCAKKSNDAASSSDDDYQIIGGDSVSDEE